MWRTSLVPSGRATVMVAPPPPSTRICARIAVASVASIPANQALSGAITAAASLADTGAGALSAWGAADASSRGRKIIVGASGNDTVRLLRGAAGGAARPGDVGDLPRAA